MDIRWLTFLDPSCNQQVWPIDVMYMRLYARIHLFQSAFHGGSGWVRFFVLPTFYSWYFHICMHNDAYYYPYMYNPLTYYNGVLVLFNTLPGYREYKGSCILLYT